MKQEQKKIKKGGFWLSIVTVIIIALVAVIIFLLLSRKEKIVEERRSVVITPENVERVLEEMEETQAMVSPGYYTVTMTSTWHFPSSKENSYDAMVENVQNNTNDVYFDVVLESDEEKVLYKSPVIPRGSRLDEITLDEPLEAGTYDCVVIYHLIDEEQNTLSMLRVALSIIVEE